MHLFDQVLKNIRMIRAHNFTARQLTEVLSELKFVKYYGYKTAGTTAIIAPLNTMRLIHGVYVNMSPRMAVMVSGKVSSGLL